MTDEEIRKLAKASWWSDNCCSGAMPTEKIYEAGFLAGLKADKDMAEANLATVAYMQGAERYKPKWHNVAGGDLPPEDTKVLALMADNEICIAHFYRKNVWDKIVTVIAWCEIPEYTEE